MNLRSLPRPFQGILVIASTGIYILLFFWLYQSRGAALGSFVTLPVVIVALLWGAWAGIIAGVLTFPLNTLLLNLVAHNGGGWDIVLHEGGGPGTLAVIFIGIIVGRLTDLGEQVKRQITERQLAESALRESEERYRNIFVSSVAAMYLYEPISRRVLDANPTFLRWLGYTLDEARTLTVYDVAAHDQESIDSFWEQVMKHGSAVIGERQWRRKDGSLLDVYVSVSKFHQKDQDVFFVIADDISERKRVESESHRRAEELAALQASQMDILAQQDLPTLLSTIARQAARLIEGSGSGLYLADAGRREVRCVVSYNTPKDYTGTVLKYGEGAAGMVAQVRRSLIIDDYRTWPYRAPTFEKEQPFASVISAPLLWRDQVLGVIHLVYTEPTRRFKLEDLELLTRFANQAAIAVGTAHLIDEARQRAHELQMVATVSAALRVASSRAEMLPIILDQVLDLSNADGAALAMRDFMTNEIAVELGRGGLSDSTGLRLRATEGVSGIVMMSSQPYLNNHIHTDPNFVRADLFHEMRAAACAPLIAYQQTIGTLWISRKNDIAESEMRLLMAIADIAANAIYRVTVHEQTEERLQRLKTLYTIDLVISSSLDLSLTLNVLLDQVTSQIQVDAADVLLLNTHTQTLEYAVGRGFQTPAMQHTRLRIGEGYAGQAALKRQTVHIADLHGRKTDLLRSPHFATEKFVAYYGIPLIAQGQIRGVLEIFHRSPLASDGDWLEFLAALGSQAAIAIDNARLFEGLQRSNIELSLAYDATIEGWSRALELREQETGRHTQRVTEMTLRLAEVMGIGESQLVHIRRGALLHDIGKMAIPDSILLKPGALTEAEWEIMRQHPSYANEMLSPVAFLHPALEIPYCHHEKWDGTGYPRGLKGEQIPLAARLFAVVDIWDALRSDRPYRQAWTKEKTLEHIRSLAGTHLEPQIIEMFMRVIGQK